MFCAEGSAAYCHEFAWKFNTSEYLQSDFSESILKIDNHPESVFFSLPFLTPFVNSFA